MAALGGFLSEVAVAVQRQDGGALAALLAVDSARPVAAVADVLRTQPTLDIAALASQRLPPPYDEVMAFHCQCLAAMAQDKPQDAYGPLVSGLTAFLREFRACEGAWAVPALLSLARGVRLTAAAADERLPAGTQAELKRLSDAGRQLQACFRAASSGADRGKRMATLPLACELFKTYFRLDTLQMCKNLTRTLEAPNAIPLDAFPVGQLVTYRFYTGRLAVFDENYAKADADLSFAFARCHVAAARNKGRVLQYLIPVKLLLGQLPSATLLRRYDLPHYGPVAAAVRSGDVRLLDGALAAHAPLFIRAGTFLLLEKLRNGVYRTLLKRVHNIQKEREPGRAFQLPIALFQAALALCGAPEMDLDECECVLANLIYRKYVKGYLSHKQRVLVLSKANPFPALSTVAFNEPL